MLKRIRNIGIVAHIDAGKTTLAERILYYSGRIHQMREVRGRDGGATMDSSPIEKKHGITIASAATSVDWCGHHINIIDTPGHVDFTVEVERSLRVLDSAVLVACAASGVQSQTITVNRQIKRHKIPSLAFVNKMDLVGASPDTVIQQLRSKLGCNALPIQIPIGVGTNFQGVIDLIEMKAIKFSGENGQHLVYEGIPIELEERARKERQELLEALAVVDDELLEELLSEREPSVDVIRNAIRKATGARVVVPVLLGSAFKNVGVQLLLTAINEYLPSPDERRVKAVNVDSGEQCELVADVDKPAVAMAFKTVVSEFGQLTYVRVYQGALKKGESYWSAYSKRKRRFGRLVRLHAGKVEDVDKVEAGEIAAVIGVDCPTGDTFCGGGIRCAMDGIRVEKPVVSMSIAPQRAEQQSQLAKALERIRREDPTFQVSVDEMTGETIVAGMGRLHLDVIVERIEAEFDCPCDIGPPRVAFKQAPTQRVEFNYKRNKQTGGPGQYGHIIGYAEPMEVEADAEFIFEHEITSGRIPTQFLSSIEKGFREQLSEGPCGKFSVVGLRIVVTDGSYHPQDSSDMAFQLCASEALRTVILPQAECELLEPCMRVEVEVPQEFAGTVAGHLTQLRGEVSDSEYADERCRFIAEVPLAELFDYSNELRSLTKGNGAFEMDLARYKACPVSIQAQ